MDRNQRRLYREHHQQQQGADPQQRLVAGRNQRHLHREVGHVEGAGYAIEGAHGNEEERRAGQIDHHVLYARLHAPGAPAVQHEAVGGDQQYLEEHEEVEDVAGQEGAVDAHELKLKEGVEVAPALVPATADGVDDHRHGEDGGEQHHQGRQAVEHQHDAERRDPIAQFVDLRRAACGLGQKAEGDGEQGDRGGGREHPLQQQVVAHGQHDEGGHQRRQHDRDDDPVVHLVPPASDPGGSPSSVSTASLPASR